MNGDGGVRLNLGWGFFLLAACATGQEVSLVDGTQLLAEDPEADVGAQFQTPKDRQRIPVKADSPNAFRDLGDVFLHKASGLRCPRSFEMARGKAGRVVVNLNRLRSFTDDGLEIGCDYLSRDNTTIVSKYASFWPDISAKDHAASSAQAMQARFGEMAFEELPQGDSVTDPAQDGEATEIYYARFNLQGKVPGGTAGWITKMDGWHVKLRVTAIPDNKETIYDGHTIHAEDKAQVARAQALLRARDAS